jgi:hypothetical protein
LGDGTVLSHGKVEARVRYLQGIGTDEIILAVNSRRGPKMSATAGLRL